MEGRREKEVEGGGGREEEERGKENERVREQE